MPIHRLWTRALRFFNGIKQLLPGPNRPASSRIRPALEPLEAREMLNSAPIAVNDGTYSVHHGQTLNVSAANGVLANDSDADNDTLTPSTVTSPSHGYISAWNNDGSFSYVANNDYVGTDTFTVSPFPKYLPL